MEEEEKSTVDVSTEAGRMMLTDMLRLQLRDTHFDPLRGIGSSGKRVMVTTPVEGLARALVPVEMTADPAYVAARACETDWKKLRCRHDFEYWCAECVTVKDKQSSRDISFRLNGPQRRVAAVLEADRRAGLPLRLILLKARQWGGSTLVQMYMAWIQTVHRTNWHSVIIAHVKDTSASIRGMYAKMLERYPEALWEGDEAAAFKPYERSVNVRRISGRDCRVTLGSSEKPDSVRGGDYAMAHLSETAFWASTPSRSPRAVIQAVCGSISLLPYTFIAVESTARGVGDYFHSEWIRCLGGQGDKHAIFVPWQEIEFYRLAAPDPGQLLATMSAGERWLWEHGCASDQIFWYRRKSKEFENPDHLHSEFPCDDVQAFVMSKGTVFSPRGVEALRQGCEPPMATGEPKSEGGGFVEDESGRMKVWRMPARRQRYVVAVDVGGRSAGSDWSVIAVLTADKERPEVVAQWRGHIDHDLLAAKSVAIARLYNNALLVIESNTYETGEYGGACDSNLFILNRLADNYNNLYMRESFDTLSGRTTQRVGFHTNRATKAMLIAGMIEAVREGLYVERDQEACNELAVYEESNSGVYAAKQGYHDDILMTRAIALHVIRSGQVPPALPEVLTQVESWFTYTGPIG